MNVLIHAPHAGHHWYRDLATALKRQARGLPPYLGSLNPRQSALLDPPLTLNELWKLARSDWGLALVKPKTADTAMPVEIEKATRRGETECRLLRTTIKSNGNRHRNLFCASESTHSPPFLDGYAPRL